MQTDIVRADRVLTRLGDLLRASLGAGGGNTVALREELRLLRLYSEIMEERFAGRVQTEWLIAKNALPVPIPSMILQLLLENAYRHGIEQTTGIERITVSAACDAGRLRMKIRNTGAALRAGWREGVGIANCRRVPLPLSYCHKSPSSDAPFVEALSVELAPVATAKRSQCYSIREPDLQTEADNFSYAYVSAVHKLDKALTTPEFYAHDR